MELISPSVGQNIDVKKVLSEVIFSSVVSTVATSMLCQSKSRCFDACTRQTFLVGVFSFPLRKKTRLLRWVVFFSL